MARQKLWNAIDINANGFLSLAELDKGIRDTLKLESIFNAKPAIIRAFEYAKSYCPAKGKNKKYGDDYVEKREFRVFLVALRQRFEYQEAFKRIDYNDDDRIDINEFAQALDVIENWVGPIDDPQAEFDSIDKNGGGIILFDEFCAWSIKKNLDLEDDDDFQD